jgi:hypothetical protein
MGNVNYAVCGEAEKQLAECRRELAEAKLWIENAVRKCAERNCSGRDQAIAEIMAELAKARAEIVSRKAPPVMPPMWSPAADPSREEMIDNLYQEIAYLRESQAADMAMIAQLTKELAEARLQHDDVAIAAASAWFALEDGLDPYEVDLNHEGIPIGQVWERSGFRNAAIGILRAIDAERAALKAARESFNG